MAQTNSRSLLKALIISLGVLALLIYGALQARSFLSGPQLVITSPRNGETVSSTSPEIVVRGHAENISFLTINGLQVFTDENGDFSRKLLVAEGYTIITVEAQDKFKRSTKEELQLITK